MGAVCLGELDRAGVVVLVRVQVLSVHAEDNVTGFYQTVWVQLSRSPHMRMSVLDVRS